MRFCEQQARQSNVDLGCLPDPTIEGAIAIRGVDHHPILDFEFDNNVVGATLSAFLICGFSANFLLEHSTSATPKNAIFFK